MWIYTEAVLCDGQGLTQENLRLKLSTITESASWVCEDAIEDREWVTELAVTLKESEILMAPKYDTDVPCVIQWGLLWFSSPSRLNQRLTNNGTNFAKYHEAVNMSIGATSALSFRRLHTPRKYPLTSVSVVLYRSLDKDWDVEKEMKGWGLGEWPCLPPYDDDWDDNVSDA